MKVSQWIFGALVVALVFGTVWVTGVGIAYYIDIPSAIIIFVGGYCISLMSHGAAGLSQGYRLGAGKKLTSISSGEIARAASVLRGLGRNFIYLAIFGMLMGLIAILTHLAPSEQMAKGLATLIIVSLYASAGNFLLVLPFRHRLEAELEGRRS